MIDWKPINSAPKDGSVLRLKRIYKGSVVSEGDGVWGILADDAPSRSPMPPDPLGRPLPAGFEMESPEYLARPRWLTVDRMYHFPEPTHWRPRDGA